MRIILPSETYENIRHLINQHCTRKHANKLIVGILKLTADYDCEQALGKFVMPSISKDRISSLSVLQIRYQFCSNIPLQIS